MKSKNTEVARYLCAAAYSNEDFCQHVINQSLEEKRRALAPCYGFDLSMIVKHCLIAQSKRKKRDIVLTVLFVIAVLCSLIDSPWGFLLVAILFAIVVVMVYLERWNTRHRLVKNNFSKETFCPESVDWEKQIREEGLELSKGSTKEIQTLREKIRQVEKEQESKVVIYGRYSPFVGCGYDIGGWSIALNIGKGKESFGKTEEPINFPLSELYEKITNLIGKISLHNIDVDTEDIYYIDGQVIRDDDRFLSSPFGRASGCLTFLETSVEEPAKANRFYKRIEISGWKGELIVSIVLRFTKFRENLFAEAKYFLLPPLQETFHRVDRVQSPPTFMQKADLVWQSFVSSFFLWPLSFTRTIYKLIEPVFDIIKKWIDILIIKENPIFNYGAVTSIRENVSDTRYRQYFQFLDQDMYLKVIESALFEDLIDFLDSKNIDTSELKNRQSQILNEGIIISGGEINAKSLSVGRRARAFFNRRKVKTIEESRRETSKAKGK